MEYLDTLTLPDLTPAEVEAINTNGSKLHYRAFVRLPVCPICITDRSSFSF